MLDFIVDLIGGWAFWRMDRLSPKAVRALAAVFVALSATATAGVVVALVLLLR